MNDLFGLEWDSPATLGAVVDAIARISTLGEARILELVSSEEFRHFFPYSLTEPGVLAADTVADWDLKEASPQPLHRREWSR